MSILERLKKKKAEDEKFFGVITGFRTAGKSTLAGTLPGRTLMLQAAVLESGSRSARALAKELGNELHVESFTSIDHLTEILKELESDTDFDHVYLDSLSALTELKYREPATKSLTRKSVWDGFRAIGDAAEDILLPLKQLTLPSVAKKQKNTFCTVALDAKRDEHGNVVEVEMAAKGRMAISLVAKLGDGVLTCLPPKETENGTTGYRLLTSAIGPYPGRIDGVLAADNPQIVEPASLATVLELLNNSKKGKK